MGYPGARRALLVDQWSPLRLPNLELWLDASHIAGLTNGDPVTTWADLSGKGNDFTQATAAKKPTWQTNVVNGRPVVRGDGTDDFMSRTLAAEIAQPWTAWLVAKHLTGSSAGNETMFGARDAASNAVAQVMLGVNVWRITAGVNLNGPASDGNWHVFVTQGNGASSLIEVDGAATTGDAGTRALALLSLFAAFNETDHADVDIAGAGLCSSLLGAGDRARLRRYLSRRFGIAVA